MQKASAPISSTPATAPTTPPTIAPTFFLAEFSATALLVEVALWDDVPVPVLSEDRVGVEVLEVVREKMVDVDEALAVTSGKSMQKLRVSSNGL